MYRASPLRRTIVCGLATPVLLALFLLWPLSAQESRQPAPRTTSAAGIPRKSATPPTPAAVAARVDNVIQEELRKAKVTPAPLCSDEDFLRRASLDIAGTSPSLQEVTLFGLDPHPQKRQHLVDKLLQSSDYTQNWSRYWRDVFFMRATEIRARAAQKPFEDWLETQLVQNRPWDAITTALITATGDVLQQGETAFIFAHGAEPDEIAAETSRIFLGIQIQCANCHDHPTDHWKRQQFHEFAAFFPRIRLQPKPDTAMRSFEIVSLTANAGGGPAQLFEQIRQDPERFIRLVDKNADKKLSREEAEQLPGGGRFFPRLIELGDRDKDGMLSIDEFKKLPAPMMMTGRGSAEYFMPDLKNPQSKGTQVDPAFFVGNFQPGTGLSDQERRGSLARVLTSPDNPWFAQAFVNRMWQELVGEGFYLPVDDLGPERTPRYPAALDALAQGFAANAYDIHWLFRAITQTETYQRQLRQRDPSQTTPAFASATPTRLRADQLYSSLLRVLGYADTPGPSLPGPGMPRLFDNSPRGQFHQLFGVDPSTPQDEILGTLPQALFFMNSPVTNDFFRGPGTTRLSAILQKFPKDQDAVTELYLLVHAREPSAKELAICLKYIQQEPDRRSAYEDLFWSLLNSAEFQTKR